MNSPSPRPTRHEVARSIAERIDWTPTYLAEFGERAAIVEQVLRAAEHETRAEVRALRAELEQVHQLGLDLGLRPAPHVRLDVAAVLSHARDMAARTPQPAEPIDWSTCPACGQTEEVCRGVAACCEDCATAGRLAMHVPAAVPQPAVPDGEDERVSVPVEVRAELHTELAKLDPDTPTWVQAGAREEPWSLWSGTAEALRAAVAGDVLAPDRHAVPDGDAPRQIIIAPDTSMTVRAALTVAASQEEDAWSLGKRLVHRHRLVMEALERDAVEQVNGEDVPARLDAAADAVDAFGFGWRYCVREFRGLADSMRRASPDVRAAVAAALARPTGHQQ